MWNRPTLSRALLLCCFLFPDVAGARAAEPADKLKELLRERLTTLKEIANQAEKAYRAGAMPVEQLQQTKQAVLRAELDLCEGDKERLEILAKMVALAKELEAAAMERVKAGVASSTEPLRAKLGRLEAEIQLERVKTLMQRQQGNAWLQVEQAVAAVEKHKERVVWSERMLKRGFVAESQVDAARAELRKAEIALEAAKRVQEQK